MKCDDGLLRQIIDDRLPAMESDIVTEHVEACQHCQSRLSELAADSEVWHSAAIALGSGSDYPTRSVVIAIDPELAPDIPLQADPISLDFLDDPSHPEMLGRIGRYDVERLIGAGGMGIVFKAFDTELHRPVAVKVLAPHLAHSGGARQRFAREARSAAAIIHENVVPIHNVDVAGKLPFLVMQYVAGESVQARVDREGPLSIDEILRIGSQTASGLAAAHDQGLVHRDVKPGNILTEQGVERVLISDFGLARAADDASVTRSGVIAGTPHYMSPEQASGKPIDGRCDLFSLGSVLYFMCTGNPPFRAEGAMAVLNRICHDTHRPVDEVNEQIPEDLAKTIDQMLAKDPARRPDSADHVARALKSMLLHGPGRTRYRRRKRLAHGALRSRRWLVGGLSTAALFVALISFWAGTPGLNSLFSEPRRRSETANSNSIGKPTEIVGEQVPRTESLDPSLAVDSSATTVLRTLDAIHDAEFFVELRNVEASVTSHELEDNIKSNATGSVGSEDAWHLELKAVDAQLQHMDWRSEWRGGGADGIDD